MFPPETGKVFRDNAVYFSGVHIVHHALKIRTLEIRPTPAVVHILADHMKPGSHGSTFGGNPVCCAGALSILHRLDGPLLQSVQEKSDFIVSSLTGAKGVKSVTGLGLMLGVETERPVKDVINDCMARGVLVISAKNKVRLLPALNIPMAQLEQAIGVLKAVCAEV